LILECVIDTNLRLAMYFLSVFLFDLFLFKKLYYHHYPHLAKEWKKRGCMRVDFYSRSLDNIKSTRVSFFLYIKKQIISIKCGGVSVLVFFIYFVSF
jgi:hypothetical protein